MAYIGYNVKQANELMEKIADAYDKLGIYTSQQWEGVSKILQSNWIGEDEQDFEVKLAIRIGNLYVNAHNLVQNSLDTIEGLVNAWHEFQQKNTLAGKDSVGNTGYRNFAGGGNKFGVDKPKIKKAKEPSENGRGGIINLSLASLDNNMDRGLQSADSKAKIQDSINTFVNEIKKQTANLFEEIQTNQAFFGDQTATIKSYIDKVGDAVGEVTVAIKDMYTALDQLAGSSYSSTVESVSEQFNQANGNVDASLNDLGNSRWS